MCTPQVPLLDAGVPFWSQISPNLKQAHGITRNIHPRPLRILRTRRGGGIICGTHCTRLNLKYSSCNRLSCALRDEMAGDVAAERHLNVIERLLALMPRTWPRSRGFWVSADGNVSVYPASPRARLPPLKSVKVIPSRPSVNRARSRQGRGQADAANARTRRSAARAAKHAERREHALSLLSGEAHAPHAGLPGLQNPCHPPERAQD